MPPNPVGGTNIIFQKVSENSPNSSLGITFDSFHSTSSWRVTSIRSNNIPTANELYFPSYLSFESALSKYGILSQIPYTLTFATTRPSIKMVLSDMAVEYHHLKGDFFFGYTLEDGKYIATAEKALLDELYLMGRRNNKIDIEELDLREINEALFEGYAAEFPDYMNRLINQVKEYIGTTPATLETKERIEWGEPVVA